MEPTRFTELVMEREQKLYRISRTLLFGAADREDAIQETLLRAWRHLGSVRDEKYFDTWLIRILINECRRVARRNDRPAATIPKLAGQSVFEMDGYTLRIEEAVFSAAANRITMTATPNPVRPIAEDGNDPIEKSYALFDENDVLIGFCWGSFADTDENGDPCLRYFHDSSVLTEPPKTVSIVAIDEGNDSFNGDTNEDWEKYIFSHLNRKEAVTITISAE